MVKKYRAERRIPTFTMRITRRKIDEIQTKLQALIPALYGSELAKARDLEARILSWPRIAAGLSNERREEIRREGGEIIAEFAFYFAN